MAATLNGLKATLEIEFEDNGDVTFSADNGKDHCRLVIDDDEAETLMFLLMGKFGVPPRGR